MQPLKTKFTNIDLAKPRDWNEETQGQCGSLPAHFDPEKTVFTSFWQPTEEELEILNSGGAVQLCVHGSGHPAVGLEATKQHLEE